MYRRLSKISNCWLHNTTSIDLRKYNLWEVVPLTTSLLIRRPNLYYLTTSLSICLNAADQAAKPDLKAILLWLQMRKTAKVEWLQRVSTEIEFQPNQQQNKAFAVLRSQCSNQCTSIKTLMVLSKQTTCRKDHFNREVCQEDQPNLINNNCP